MIPLEDAKEEIKKNIEARHIKASTRIIKRNIFYTWDAVSLLVNGKLYKGIEGQVLFLEFRTFQSNHLPYH